MTLNDSQRRGEPTLLYTLTSGSLRHARQQSYFHDSHHSNDSFGLKSLRIYHEIFVLGCTAEYLAIKFHVIQGKEHRVYEILELD
mmetsp:Transcript_5173/g.9845  ORF Transcript_5173/g.9845 Transcript_5173/m.9845 type:complete len:85 (+) Transcript_5173:1002-1256(+)